MTESDTGARLFALFDEAERTLPVAEWRIGGLRVWPVLRCYHGFETLTQRMFRGDNQIARYSRGFARVRQIAQGFLGAARARRADAAHESALTAADVLIVGVSTTRFFKVDGAWYNPYSDSFTRHLDAAGLRSIVLELTPDSDYRLPRFAPSAIVQDRMFIRSLIAKAAARFRRLPESLPGWDAFIALSDRHVGADKRPSLQRLRFRVWQVRLFERWFRSVLATVRPRVVLTPGYYSTDMMGLTVACRAMGVTSIDIQHGVQGDYHVAYHPWSVLPPEGFEVLPEVWWCWSELEQAEVLRWARGHEDRHRPLVGGNPCLSIYDRQGRSLTDALRERLLAARGAPDGTQVLFTAQAFYEPPGLLVEAMRRSPPGWTWWIRVHPQYWETREPLRRALTAHGLSNFLIEEASDYPLVSVLGNVDVHVTEFSSSVLEAQALGVPSVVVSERGAAIYQSQIAAGFVTVALDGESLLRETAAQATRRAALAANVPDPSDLFRRGVEQLVALAQARRA